MTSRRLVDTNLIVRYLGARPSQHTRAAARIFDACDRGELVIVILTVVLAECAFVLESFYQHLRSNIATVLEG